MASAFTRYSFGVSADTKSVSLMIKHTMNAYRAYALSEESAILRSTENERKAWTVSLSGINGRLRLLPRHCRQEFNRGARRKCFWMELGVPMLYPTTQRIRGRRDRIYSVNELYGNKWSVDIELWKSRFDLTLPAALWRNQYCLASDSPALFE